MYVRNRQTIHRDPHPASQRRGRAMGTGEVCPGCVAHSMSYDVPYLRVLIHPWGLKTIPPDCGAMVDANVDSAKIQGNVLVVISFPILSPCPRGQNKGLGIDPEQQQSSYQRVHSPPKVTLQWGSSPPRCMGHWGGWWMAACELLPSKCPALNNPTACTEGRIAEMHWQFHKMGCSVGLKLSFP